jgi:hypothetical protein
MDVARAGYEQRGRDLAHEQFFRELGVIEDVDFPV